MEIFWRFMFGAVFGSFLNVLSLRYDPEKFILDTTLMGGRSRCPHCKKTLAWYELIPIASFAVQRGRCRACRARLTLQYPLVELLTALLFVFVPMHFDTPYISPATFYAESILWTAVFTVLLLVAVIDLRLQLIPDEASVLLFVIGLALIFLPQTKTPLFARSFLGPYALLFGFEKNLVLNRIVAVGLVAAFFGALIAVTRGRGMGWGDFKLAIPLALLFGWPDILFLAAMSFIAGSIVGVPLILMKRKTMKSALPFGPFLAFAAALTFFFGYAMVDAYFRLFVP